MQFINPQEAEAKIAARYRVFLILWVAMLASIALLLALAAFVASSGRANRTLSSLLFAISLIAVIVSVLIKYRLLKQAIEKQQTQILMNAYIIGFALCEAAALFGLMDRFVTGSGFSRFALMAAVVGMLLHFPKKDHVRAVSYKQF